MNLDWARYRNQPLHGLDDIPWHSLHHAYGTAEDVPELIRQLKVADPNADNEDSPLWHLFGNIWHQGTVYEATSYAVPFLIQLIEDPSTPDRVGILRLLASIAKGTSYLDVHEDFLTRFPVKKIGIPGTDEFETKKATELKWVESARSAVEAGYDCFSGLIDSLSDVAYAAANVLTSLSVGQNETAELLFQMLEEETRTQYRAGLLILLGEIGLESNDVCNVIVRSAASEAIAECRAAVITVARFRSIEVSDTVRSALADTICDDDLECHFEGLPWDAMESINHDALFNRDAAATNIAVARLIERAESGSASCESFCTLCQLLFDPKVPPVPESLSSDQQRTLKAIVHAIDTQDKSLSLSLASYGLPESHRQLRRLANGQPCELEIDQSLPVIGDASVPTKPRLLRKLKAGDRIHSRYFGLGTVLSVTHRRFAFELVVDFDEEGRTTLGLTDSRLRYAADFACHLLRKVRRRD